MTSLAGPSYYPSRQWERLIVKAQDNGERLIEKADGERDQTPIYILDIGNGKVEEIIPYNQLEDHFESAKEDNEISDDLYKFCALIGHQGPLKATDPIGKDTSTISLLNGRLGRRPMHPSQF